MDPDEIVKHIPDVANTVKTIGTGAGIAVPFTGIMKRMFGPAADELAEMWRDQVRMYRYERQLKCVKKAERMAQEAGFTPRAVPPKILFPLLEGVSFEENENLHDMWAALLANASSPENAGKVRPGFIATLKQMSPDEASVLNFIADRSPNNPVSIGPSGFYGWSGGENTPNISGEDLAISLDGLEAVQLLRRSVVLPPTDDLLNHDRSVALDDEGPYSVTNRGHAFLEACRPPKPKEIG